MRNWFIKFKAVSVLLVALTITPHVVYAKGQPVEGKSLSGTEVLGLVKRAAPDVQDAKGWGKDIAGILHHHDLRPNRKNVCALIAILGKESGFRANPPLPGAGKLAKRLNRPPSKARQKVERWLKRHPKLLQNYQKLLDGAQSERDLDLVYRRTVSALLKKKLNSLQKIKLIRSVIEKLNAVDTIGSMQVSVAFAIRTEEHRQDRKLNLEEIWKLRDRMYERREGLSFGALRLLGYDPGYDDMIYRFADYNSGRYSSRNAAFQLIISELLGKKLALDGDLLRYRKSGKPTFRRSKTEKAIRKLAKKERLDLGKRQIHADLMREKKRDFVETKTFRLIRDLYQKQTGGSAPFAIVPRIKMISVKSRHILSVQKYADGANGRYKACRAGMSKK